ncbi:MAG TPA: hypothetical protein VMZ11_06990 [Mycobacteriales bacterium]|nr:hypothetical protein [Mycobacteriales bacterium]
MSGPAQRDAVSVWHVLWLLVFAVDASLQGHGRAHQMGAVGLGVLFATLVVSEVVATRRQSYDD